MKCGEFELGLWRERHKIAAAVFCPWCGVNSLIRYDKTKPTDNGQGFWCSTCLQSFRLDRSIQYREALAQQPDYGKMQR